MIRLQPRVLLAAALLAGCAAPPRPAGPAAGGAFQPAPTPDGGAAPSRPGEAELAPAVLSPYRDGFESNGYPTGSVYGNFEDNPTSRGPGMRLTVPTGF